MKRFQVVVVFLLICNGLAAQSDPDSSNAKKPAKADSLPPVENSAAVEKEAEPVVVPPPLDTVAAEMPAAAANAQGQKGGGALRKANLYYAEQAYSEAIP